MWIIHILMMLKRNHLIMIVITKKGENVNVWIHDFDYAKEESNKVASKDKHCFKINIRLLQQKKSCFKINSRSNLVSKQSVSKISKALTYTGETCNRLLVKKFRNFFLKRYISSNYFEKTRRAYVYVCLISKNKREIF